MADSTISEVSGVQDRNVSWYGKVGDLSSALIPRYTKGTSWEHFILLRSYSILLDRSMVGIPYFFKFGTQFWSGELNVRALLAGQDPLQSTSAR